MSYVYFALLLLAFAFLCAFAPSRQGAGLRSHAAVLGGFFVLAALLWWPLPMHLATHAPGAPTWAYDEATFVWNIWYFKHALFDLLQSPLHSSLIYYPLGVDLILYTYNFYHVLASLPLALATNYVLASNVSLLMATALSGYGTWLLVRWLLAREGVAARAAGWAALVAGAIFAYGSNRSVYAALGHYDMVTTQWIPFYALALLRSLDTHLSASARRRAAVLAGIFIAFAGLAEMITALFLAIFTLIVLLAHPGDARRRERALLLRWRIWLPSFAILGGVGMLLWSPALLPILYQFLVNDFALKGWGEAIPLSTDLMGWLTPTVLHPWFGSDLVAELRRVQLRALDGGVTGFRDLNTVFLGWVTAALALTGALAWRRRSRIWWWTAIVFGLFTLGPFLQINGEYLFNLDGVDATFPLPYTLLHYIPIIKANRAPNRNSVVLMLALAVLVGYAIAWLWGVARARWARRGISSAPRWIVVLPLAAGLLAIGEHLVVPMSLTDMRVPAVYAQIAADTRPVAVMQLPLGWRNSFGVFGPEATILQWYQSVHAKPMLGGNISRAPDFKMEYFKRLPYFQALTDVEFGRELSPELLAAATAQAPALMRLYNVGYVLLFPPVEGRPPYSDTWQASWDFAKATLPLEDAPFWTGDGIEAYRLMLHAPEPSFALDLGDEDSLPYRGDGWAAGESAVDGANGVWATARTGTLYVPPMAQTAQPVTLRMRLQPYGYPGAAAQTVSVRANGTPVGDAHTLADGWQEVDWVIPPGLLGEGLLRLDLAWGRADAPRAVNPGSRSIGSTSVAMPVDADIKAFADGGFIALFDEDGVQTDASAGRKGVNVTVLEPGSGRVVAQQGFDTTANTFESDGLAAFVRAVAAGHIVLVASNGDAWAHLTQDAVDALRATGADVTLEGLQNQYFALVGVQGAAPGTAAQAIDPADAFLRVSLERDRRPLAAIVDWIKFGE